MRPLLVNLSSETEPENSLRMLRQYSVDGVIVASSTLSPQFAKAFSDAQILVVHSFGRCASAPDVHVVGIDNVECGRMAARTLLARRYRKIGFLGGTENATSTIDRRAGFLEALDGAKVEGADVRVSYADAYSFAAGRAEMLRLLQKDPAQAYFCGDDVLSIGALSAIDSSGLKVPRDIGIIGLNDMEMAKWENINLTTIRQPIKQIVESSVQLVLAAIEDSKRHPEARLFACETVERCTLRPRQD